MVLKSCHNKIAQRVFRNWNLITQTESITRIYSKNVRLCFDGILKFVHGIFINLHLVLMNYYLRFNKIIILYCYITPISFEKANSYKLTKELRILI